jgi:plastocyanin
MPANHKITLTLGAIGVEADPAFTRASVGDDVTFYSGDGSQMYISFIDGRSPFRTSTGKVIATVQATEAHTCRIEDKDNYKFICEIRDDSGNLVAYDVGDGGTLNVGH